jgi:hypothetical protein
LKPPRLALTSVHIDVCHNFFYRKAATVRPHASMTVARADARAGLRARDQVLRRERARRREPAPAPLRLVRERALVPGHPTRARSRTYDVLCRRPGRDREGGGACGAWRGAPRQMLTRRGNQRVRRYLHAHGVREGLWFDPDGHHGQVRCLLRRPPRPRPDRERRRYSRAAASTRRSCAGFSTSREGVSFIYRF